MKNPPNAGLFRLIWPPGGGSDAPKTKIGVPRAIGWGRAHSILLRRLRTKNAQSSKWFEAGYICTLQQVPTSTTPPNTFHFWNRVPFHFFGPKKPKSRPQSTLFNFQKLNLFQWSSSKDLWAKIWKFFFLSSNFWNILKFLIFLKKRIWFPLSYNCNLYLKTVLFFPIWKRP